MVEKCCNYAIIHKNETVNLRWFCSLEVAILNYKRILSVQDISCIGQCSLTVALPILAACGVETCVLPSAVLSSHTGGFKNPYIRDLTEDLSNIISHWQRENITFDGICTGYLGSIRQIDIVLEAFTLKADTGKIVVDPAMADHGKLYRGFDEAFVSAMRGLCLHADVLIPNISEACMLTGETYGAADSEVLVDKLHTLGIPNVVLTGVNGNSEDETGILVSEQGRKQYYFHPKTPKSYHGTGDIFAAAFMGSWMQDLSLFKAGKLAADFTSACIENTYRNPAHWYGVKFEPMLPQLANMIREVVKK